jgi:hypothetical protein
VGLKPVKWRLKRFVATTVSSSFANSSALLPFLGSGIPFQLTSTPNATRAFGNPHRFPLIQWRCFRTKHDIQGVAKVSYEHQLATTGSITKYLN